MEQQDFAHALEITVKRLQDNGIEVVVMKEVPEFSFDPPRTLGLAMLRGQSVAHLATYLASHRERTRRQNEVFTRLESLGVRFLDPAPLFADPSGVIRPSDALGTLWRDSHHLSTHGSMRLKAAFCELLKSKHANAGHSGAAP